MSDMRVQDVGQPDVAGDSRGGDVISLVVLGDDRRPAAEALASFRDAAAPALPNYYIDRLGGVFRLVAEGRAGRGLGEAEHEGFIQPIDPIAVSVLLQKRATAGYDGPQLRALHALLDELRARYWLDDAAVARVTSADGLRLVRPYVPPPPPRLPGAGLLDDVILGAAPAALPPSGAGEAPGPTAETELPLGSAPPLPEAGVILGGPADAADPAELWRFLLGETYKPRGGALHPEWAFTIFAAANRLGAPVGPNPAPVVSGGVTYNYQPFARDTVYNIGTNFGDVRRLSGLLGPGSAIPGSGPAHDLLAASYRAALDAAAARGVALSGNQRLNPGWKFHQVARGAGLGPALSGNYLTADRRYIVQVFAGDTLFTPSTQQAGCTRLSQIGPDSPAYAPIWAETYRAAPAPYDPASPLQAEAARLHIGAPLTGAYDTSFAGAPYLVQVFALDTLYLGGDGVVRRMSDLPLPEEMAWPPGSRRLTPDPGPRRLAIDVGPPRRGDPAWPPPPPFSFLGSRAGAVEAALGHIEWVRAIGAQDPDAVRITNGWAEEHLVVVEVPQLRRFPLAANGRVRFHRRAAAQLQRLFADWEEAGLLGLILSYQGAYNARTIRSTIPGQTTNILSNHAYGTAFDINQPQNTFKGQPALVGQVGSVRELVPLAYANGFYWGGHFTYRGGGHDGMHFEWAIDV